jgi:hypothetical protein
MILPEGGARGRGRNRLLDVTLAARLSYSDVLQRPVE